MILSVEVPPEQNSCQSRGREEISLDEPVLHSLCYTGVSIYVSVCVFVMCMLPNHRLAGGECNNPSLRHQMSHILYCCMP